METQGLAYVLECKDTVDLFAFEQSFDLSSVTEIGLDSANAVLRRWLHHIGSDELDIGKLFQQALSELTSDEAYKSVLWHTRQDTYHLLL